VGCGDTDCFATLAMTKRKALSQRQIKNLKGSREKELDEETFSLRRLLRRLYFLAIC
jgi:hypothetical protein